NRGIDDIRDIRERVRYAPAGGGKKVYIVDEVHMLTDQAFNAFLKTLEEPPPHVVFVFATTDPEALLETVRSRCQRYDFHRISVKQAFERLKWIAEREKLDVEDGALHFLARRSEGSLRDALVLLDQAVNSGEARITEAGLAALLGHADSEFFFQLSDAIEQRQPEKALQLLAGAISRRTRETLIFAGLCEHFRALLLARVSSSLDGLLEGTPEMLARYREAAQRFPEEDLLQCLDLCLDGAARLERSPHPRFQLELLVVTLARLDSVKSLQRILGQLEGGGMPAAGSRGASAGQAPASGLGAAPRAAERLPQPGAERAPQPAAARPGLGGAVSAGAPLTASAAAAARKSLTASVAALPVGEVVALPEGVWPALLARVGEARRTLGAILEVAQPLGCQGDALCVSVSSDFHRLQLESREHTKFWEAALAELGLPARRLHCISAAQAVTAPIRVVRPAGATVAPAPAAGSAAAVNGLAGPAAGTGLATDPPPAAETAAPPAEEDLVDKVLQIFGGEVVP
ncbi:MAG TPA: hypothetical protein VMS93_11910, partial [Candidatus Saccharimonadales bacterium]|nr:hypothetical protein [Candidatus Saccharimonadales bacterium]